jgi:hypothetical protein
MTNKIEETGGELSDVPNEKYAKFFALFQEIETLPVEQWKVAHLLGHFCKRYQEAYKVKYPWKFNNPSPSKCFEVWQINTLVAKLSKNPQIIKDYIDWSFTNLVPKAKRRLTSISFMTRDEVVIPYKMNVLLADKKNLNVDRSTPLPNNYRDLLRASFPSISTYGDLAFVCQMDSPPGFAEVMEQMKEAGFDFEIIKRIV